VSAKGANHGVHRGTRGKRDLIRVSLVCAGPLQQALGAGAGYVHHGGIGDDAIENRLNGRDLGELTVVARPLHALEFFVESQLLVVVVVLEAVSDSSVAPRACIRLVSSCTAAFEE